MIITKEVWVGVSNSIFKYYEKLGYEIPKRKYHNYVLSVQRGTKILVKVSDLPKFSGVKILAKCDNCGKVREVSFFAYSPLCNSCENKTEEHRRKNREKNSGKNHPQWGKRGKDSSAWNPNLTDEERESRNRKIAGLTRWKKDVKKRDNYKCQICGSTEKLHVHHLNNWKDFPEQRVLLENGITLCHECHKAANNKSYHTLYGQKHNTKQQFSEWLEKIGNKTCYSKNKMLFS